MTERRLRQNRRGEPRYCVGRGQLLVWKPDGKGRRGRKGWLHDLSSSGISFIIEGPRKPEVGDNIIVGTGAGSDLVRCRVVHSVKQDSRISMVGCCKGTGHA